MAELRDNDTVCVIMCEEIEKQIDRGCCMKAIRIIITAQIFFCFLKTISINISYLINCLVNVNYLISASLKLFFFKQGALKKVRAVCLIFFDTRYLNFYLISVHKLDIVTSKQKLAI